MHLFRDALLLAFAAASSSCLYGNDECGELHDGDRFEDRAVSCPASLPFMCVQAHGPTSCQATANQGVPGIQCAECASESGCVLEAEANGPDACVSSANPTRDDYLYRHCVCAGFPQASPCTSDDDCVYGELEFRCDDERGICVTCLSDRDCVGDLVCSDGQCTECEYDDDCTSGEHCSNNGTCISDGGI